MQCIYHSSVSTSLFIPSYLKPRFAVFLFLLNRTRFQDCNCVWNTRIFLELRIVFHLFILRNIFYFHISKKEFQQQRNSTMNIAQQLKGIEPYNNIFTYALLAIIWIFGLSLVFLRIFLEICIRVGVFQAFCYPITIYQMNFSFFFTYLCEEQRSSTSVKMENRRNSTKSFQFNKT